MPNIRKRGDSYLIRAYVGYDTNGKQIVKTMTWKPTETLTPKKLEKELNRVAVEFEERAKNGECIASNIRFSEYADKWLKRGLENGEKPLSPNTYYRYELLLNRINQSIGNIPLNKLQPNHIRDFLSNLQEEGIREDNTYTLIIDLKSKLNKKIPTLKELANKIGISNSTLYSITHGKNASQQTASAICSALKLKLDKAFKTNPVNDGKLSEKTILHHYRLISAILNSAVMDDQALLYNPAKRVRPPHITRQEALYLDEKQASHMIDLLYNEPIQYRTMILLLLYSGMRRGELCGLEWKDIDFENHIISIQRTSQYTPEKGIFEKGTKTASSVRTIKLPSIVFTILKDYKKWQTEERLKIGDQWEEHDRLYTSWNGKPAHPDTITQWFESFINKTDLPKIHLHSLRHTNATLMIAGGEDIRTVSRRLGHAQVTTTVNIYTHAIQSADAKASETLENLLDPLSKNKTGVK